MNSKIKTLLVVVILIPIFTNYLLSQTQINPFDIQELNSKDDIENLFKCSETLFSENEISLINLSIEKINKEYGTDLQTKSNIENLIKLKNRDNPIILKNKHDYIQKMDSLILIGYSQETNFKNKYTYDENGLVASLTRLYIDPNTGYETLADKVEYTNEEFEYTRESFYWDSILELWIPAYKNYTSWDITGFITEIRNLNWDKTAETWITNYLILQSYDSLQNIYTYEHYDWDNYMQMLVGISKFDVKVNENDYIIEDINYLWNYDIESWDLYYKRTFEYNDFNEPDIYRFYFWEDEEWKNIIKGEYEYDNNQNEIRLTMYELNEELQSWEQYAKTEKEYTASNLIEIEASYLWNIEDSVWNYDEKRELTYYENDYIDNVVLSLWIEELDTLLKRSKYSYQYNSNNQMTLYLTQHWDTTFQNWLNFSKWEYSYDTDSNNISRSIYRWEDSTIGWRGSILQNFTYDEFRNKLSSESFDWDYSAWDWIGTFKYTTDYDYLYSIDEISMPFLLNFWFNKPLSKYDYSWDSTIDNWSQTRKTIYYYSDWETRVQEIENQTMKIYPNPARDIISIINSENTLIQIKLINSLGETVLYKKQNLNENIDISHLKSGLYFVELFDINNKNKIVRKLIKQ